MNDTCDKAGLARAENRLQDAVRAGDAATLAEMLHDELLATAPDGRLVDKKEDIAGYASGDFQVDAFHELERHLLLVGTTGVSLILARVVGRQAAANFDVRMRYTRTWSFDGAWRVVAAHLSEAHV